MTLLAILTANAVLSIVNFIYQCVLAGQSTQFNPGYETETAYYTKGPFTLETWTCGAPKYYSGFNEHGFGVQCTGEKASRILSVLLGISVTAMLGLLWWDMESGHIIVTPKRKEIVQDEDSWD
jgi:hypothetical protein